jgi:hypothetical protein
MNRLLVAALMLVAVVCPAATITFDPVFPNIPPGVLVQYFDNGLTGPLPVLPTPNAVGLSSTSSAIPSSGNALLTWQSSQQFGPYGVLFTFDTPIVYFAAVGNDFGGDSVLDNEIAHLTGFDGLGNVVGTASYSSPFAVPNLKYPALTVLSGMKFVAFTWTVDLGYYAVDNVDYETSVIPEPATWALLGTGLAALAFLRRRK